MISYDGAKALLDYDPLTGEFTHKYTARNAKKGEKAGYVHAHGYLILSLNGKEAYAHRVAWLLHYGTPPVAFLEHIDGDRLNNRISNLRPADHYVNNGNAVSHRQGKPAGIKEIKGRFYARITVKGQTCSLGVFSSLVEAEKAREDALKNPEKILENFYEKHQEDSTVKGVFFCNTTRMWVFREREKQKILFSRSFPTKSTAEHFALSYTYKSIDLNF
jgi:hypothetical protein